jgi:hypothetical protein
MPRFAKGNKAAPGGKREGAGRKSAAELKAKESRLEVWQRELEKWDERHARRLCEQGMVDNQVLLAIRKTAVPDAKQEIELSGQLKVVRIKAPDLNG